MRCLQWHRVVAATVVDHKTPHRGDQRLFWDPDNWQALCAPCHDRDKQSEEHLGFVKDIGDDGWPTDPRHPANKGSLKKN